MDGDQKHTVCGVWSLDSLMQKYGGCFHVNHLNLTEISPRCTSALMEPVMTNRGK